MSEITIPTAVLDACVLYPAPMRDTLLCFAEQRLYMLQWSDIITDEWLRNLLKNRPDLKKEKSLRTIAQMNSYFDEANVADFEYHIPTIQLPDPDDRHVVACAIRGGATIIVTKNLKDFPAEELAKFDLIAQDPDNFICDLFEMDKKNSAKAFKAQLISLKNPPQTKEELLETFRNNDFPKAAELFAQITE